MRRDADIIGRLQERNMSCGLIEIGGNCWLGRLDRKNRELEWQSMGFFGVFRPLKRAWWRGSEGQGRARE